LNKMPKKRYIGRLRETEFVGNNGKSLTKKQVRHNLEVLLKYYRRPRFHRNGKNTSTKN